LLHTYQFFLDQLLGGSKCVVVALFFVTVLLCFSTRLGLAQDGYFADWFRRVDKTQAEQPHWVTPLATTTPRLEEEIRYDQLWQENAKGITTNNYDGGKGAGIDSIREGRGHLQCPTPHRSQ
jgi:hypothetical protein